MSYQQPYAPEPEPQWQHPPTYPVPAQPRNGFGVTSLVLGIVGACFALIPVVGVIAWPMVIVGLVFGILAIRRVRKGAATNKGQAVAGTALSGVGLVLCFVWLFAFGASVNQYEQDMQRIKQDMRQLEQGMPEPATVPTPTGAPESVPAPAPAEAPEPDTAGLTAGTYLVGEDIQPGTYKSAGPMPSYIPNCYWERLSDTSGEFTAIISNGWVTTEGESIVVTIEPGDAAFATSGCQPFKRVEQ